MDDLLSLTLLRHLVIKNKVQRRQSCTGSSVVPHSPGRVLLSYGTNLWSFCALRLRLLVSVSSSLLLPLSPIASYLLASSRALASDFLRKKGFLPSCTARFSTDFLARRFWI